ncbi:MAG: stage II sporulation protein M [Planctomycetes bacterium]|nr:stage II sporulation protein M [Planctomycetota bacterium]
MNRRQWIRERTQAWKRFERLVNRVETVRRRRRSAAEVAEFSRLFRELAGDLALVRSRGWGEKLESYLNHLAARAHSGFYTAPAGNFGRLVRFLTVGYPRLFRANIGWFAAAAALFFVPLAIAWVTIQHDPSLGGRVVPQERLDMMAAMYDYDPDDRDRPFFDESRARMGGFYVLNNVGIALRCFAGGVLLGAFTVYTLLANGIMIGTVAGYILAAGHGKAFTSFVISHGSFELTAIAVAGGAGLILGDSLLHPGCRTRIESLRVRGLEAVKIAGGAAAMLFVAALLEAFWSPSGVSSTLKYIVGAGLWLLVALYLGLAGREDGTVASDST